VSASIRRILLVAALAITMLALPGPAAADNCSSLADCYGLMEAAALALLAMAVLAFLLFNPWILVGLAGLLESMFMTPMGWITGWGRASAAGVASTLTEAELAALRARLIAEDLRALGTAAFNPSGAANNCYYVTDAVLGWAGTGVATGAEAIGGGVTVGLAAELQGGVATSVAGGDAVAAALANAGNGARAVVGVFGDTFGHWFAGMNVNGSVVFADMQVSGIVSASAGEVAAGAGYGAGSSWWMVLVP
jgi:hypothetical protein